MDVVGYTQKVRDDARQELAGRLSIILLDDCMAANGRVATLLDHIPPLCTVVVFGAVI